MGGFGGKKESDRPIINTTPPNRKPDFTIKELVSKDQTSLVI